MIEARYMDIAKNLKTRIGKGDWQKRLPGISVLSQQYEANPRTISKALKTLSDEGVVTIRGTKGTYITQYTPRRRYNVIGALGLAHDQKPDIEQPSIEEVAQASGYHLLCIDHSSSMLHNGLKILKDLPVDGLIFTNSLLTTDVAAELREAGIPFISVNRITEIGGINWIDFDNEDGLAQVYNYLLARGHRRIASVSFKSALAEHDERMGKLYQTTMTKADCYDPTLYIHNDDQLDYYKHFGENYYEILGAQKAGLLLNQESPPTAVITANIPIANGFCRYASQIGIRVPEDLSVVAISQSYMETSQEKFLTVLLGSTRDRACRITQTLLNLIDDPFSEITQELLPMELIEHESVAPAKYRRSQ
jgi:LacI family transcriptional regulator